MDIRTAVPTIYGDEWTRFGETWKSQVQQLRERFHGQIEDVRMPQEQPTDVPIVYVKKSAVIEVLGYLKAEPGFDYDFLADITATDEEVDPRFEVVYNLYSTVKKCRIRIKVRVAENEDVPTAVGVWAGANWAEREVYDMFGVKFAGHPDLRRILMDYRWVGHPLRKDYPLRGYQIFPTTAPIDTDLLK